MTGPSLFAGFVRRPLSPPEAKASGHPNLKPHQWGSHPTAFLLIGSPAAPSVNPIQRISFPGKKVERVLSGRPRFSDLQSVMIQTFRNVAFMALAALSTVCAVQAQDGSQANGALAPPAAILGDDFPQVSGPLSLQRAVDIALRTSPSVSALQAAVRAAQQETRAASAMTRPQMSANMYLSTGSMSNILGTSSNVTPVNSIIVPGRPSADQNLTLMIPLYTGGRLGSLVRAASHSERAAGADVGAARSDTALAVRDAYYRTLLAGEIVKAAQARVDAGTELVLNAQNQFEAGKGIQAQVSRAQAELADAQRMLTSSQNDRAKALLDLMAAMGVRPDSDVTLSDTLTYTPPTGDLNHFLQQANRSRPELVAARDRVDAAGAQVSAERGSSRPQVYGLAMADGFTPGNMRQNAGGTVGAAISLPLFDAGQRNAEVAQAQAGEQRARAELRSAEIVVSTEIRESWLDVRTAGVNYTTAQAALRAAQDAYDITLLRVQNGKAIQVELLDATTALTQARANLAQALYDHSIAAARLKRAVGEI